jgi:hypothetical protein
MNSLVSCSGVTVGAVEEGRQEGRYEGERDNDRVGLLCLTTPEGEPDSGLARESAMTGQHGSSDGRPSIDLFRE